MLHLIAGWGREEGKQIAQFFVSNSPNPRGLRIDFLPLESWSEADICLFMIIFEERHTHTHFSIPDSMSVLLYEAKVIRRVIN